LRGRVAGKKAELQWDLAKSTAAKYPLKSKRKCKGKEIRCGYKKKK
jgi:hypothetical protein